LAEGIAAVSISLVRCCCLHLVASWMFTFAFSFSLHPLSVTMAGRTHWRRALILAGLNFLSSSYAISQPASALSLSSLTTDAGLKASLGEYVAVDGSLLNGKPFYTRTASSLPQNGERVLFYSSADRWSIAKSVNDATASKRAVVMSVERSASSPLGLGYRFYSGEGSWKVDESFTVNVSRISRILDRIHGF